MAELPPRYLSSLLTNERQTERKIKRKKKRKTERDQTPQPPLPLLSPEP
jgi:hypothetical protein